MLCHVFWSQVEYKIVCFITSDLIEHDWDLTTDDGVSFMIGGLRLPCFNACYSMDSKDKLGKTLQSFDGLFESEREKETYHTESMLRRLGSKSAFDDLKSCRITRHLSLIRHLLDKYGKEKKLPRSAVIVDEDFHYMCRKYGCDDDSLCEREQSWPKSFIFNTKNLYTQPLNVTLSMTCKDDIKAENLKECLFEDPFLSRSKFFEIRKGGKDSFFTNYDQYFCCKCEYVKCDHFNDATNLSQSSRDYYSDTCPVCVFKLSRPCYRTSDACCIKGMKKDLDFRAWMKQMS